MSHVSQEIREQSIEYLERGERVLDRLLVALAGCIDIISCDFCRDYAFEPGTMYAAMGEYLATAVRT
jgi:hypothetical protein